MSQDTEGTKGRPAWALDDDIDEGFDPDAIGDDDEGGDHA